MSFIRLAARTALPRLACTAPRMKNQLVQRARFSAAAGLSRDAIQSRVFEVLKGFEKVDASKVSKAQISFCDAYLLSLITQLTATSSFSTDLGLDSLDSVELVMAVEEVRSLAPLAFYTSKHVALSRSLRSRFRMLRPMKSKQCNRVRVSSRIPPSHAHIASAS